jgi:4-hydroxy-3-methylbut-2-en-1-yl diphosphate reductase
MLNLRVNIDPNSGFCFGVVYATEMAEEILEQQGHLFCLGDIVHNDEEIKRLEKKGLKIIGHDELKNLYNEKVLIRAHGEPPSTYKIAVENDLELIDASCPVVLKLQNRIKNAHDKEENIFIYGKHGHAEVVGLLGQTQNTATIFQNFDDLDEKSLPAEVTLFSQTTKSLNSFYDLANKLQQAGVKVNANDTICRQVSNRDQELREFVKDYEVIMFVSGVKSSNGKSLFKVCKENNPNTFFISNPEQINRSWFSEKDKVGICGATSTPWWLMEEVKKMLEKF